MPTIAEMQAETNRLNQQVAASNATAIRNYKWIIVLLGIAWLWDESRKGRR